MYRIITKLLFIFCLLNFSCKETSESETPEEEIKTKEITAEDSHITLEEGARWDVLGSKIKGKILSSDTNGEYAVIITETPPNGGPPKHIHTKEDELFYVLQGTYEFVFGDELIIAEKGDMVHLPKGKAHTFKNIDSITGITMNTITPGGFEGFFADISTLSKQNLLGRQQIDSLANQYHIKFLKPE